MKKGFLIALLVGSMASTCQASALDEDHQFDALYYERATQEQDTSSIEPLMASSLEENPISETTVSSGLAEYVATESGMGIEYGIDIANLILHYSAEYGVDPVLAASLFNQESHFRMDAYSSAGAIGIAQLMPDTAASLGYNPYDIDDNVHGGIEYLGYQLQRFSYAGNLQVSYAIAAYNAGPQAIMNYGDVPPWRETRNHVTAVAQYYQTISSII